MKRTNLIYALSATLLFAVSCNSSTDSNGQVQISIPVFVEEVTRSSLEQLTSTNGTLVPTASATVTNSVGGVYKPVKNPATGRAYKIGDQVKKGELLALLEDESYVNDISIETKKINWEIAEGEYEKYVALQKKGGATEVEVKEAAVAVTTTKTEYENAKISLEYLRITSPIDGVIVDLEYQTPGVEIASDVSLFTVMDYAEMLLEVSLSESTMSSIESGMDVYVSHYSMPDNVLEATIDQLSPYIDADTRTYKCVILVDNHDLVLKPGMFVKTDIVVDKVNRAIVIPKEIIRTMNGRSTVFTADGTTAMQQSITTGIENDTYIEVKRGLQVGDKLIVDGYSTLRNRSKIAIQ